MSAWSRNPYCDRCPRKKGKNQRSQKYCATCQRAVKKEQKEAAHGKRILDTYGLTAEEYRALYELQGGRCALCRWATGRSRRLSVDHDHKTGKVRGLLCRPCNNMLGHARDLIAFFERCIAYLANPPFERLKKGEDWPY